MAAQRREQRTAAGPAVSRRRLLQLALGAGAGAMAARFGMPTLAHAMLPRAPTRRFVFCYFGGGWDQLLFLDPRPDNGDRGATLTDTQYGALEGYEGFSSQLVRAGSLTFGPAVQRPGNADEMARPQLAAFADRIAVVRGMNMGTLGHEIGYKYSLTGQFPTGIVTRGTTVACELAAQMGSTLPVPNFSLQVEQQNVSHDGRYNAVVVESLEDLGLVFGREAQLTQGSVAEQALEAFATGEVGCEVSVYDRAGLYTQLRRADATGRDFLRRNLAASFRFAFEDDAASQELRRRYNVPQGDANAPGARAAFAATAIKLGVAQCVSVNMGVGLDTHFVGNQQHATSLYRGIAALAALLDDLARSDAPAELQRLGGRSWLDHTTVVAFSEFARTPLFNSSGGRDHHLCNSCLLAGAGIRGNTVVGESGSIGMAPGRYDVRARRAVTSGDAGENLTPAHLCATLLASAGLEYNFTGLRAEPLWAALQGV